MNRSISIIAGCILLVSCSTEEYELKEGTGIKGTVSIGDPYDPDLGCEYELYNGLLYFLSKADLESHVSTSDDVGAVIAHMKGHSYTTWVGYGALDCGVPVGQYYLATRDDFNLASEDVITIEEGKMLQLEIIFNDCIRR